MLDVLKDTLIDFLKLLPFLFLTYLLLEFIEHKAEEKMTSLIRRAGAWGPVIGSALGLVPQCGFSTAASNLYAQRLLSAGTLLAVYLSTSDEMLPILISSAAPSSTIVRILTAKCLIGLAAGLLTDRLIRPFRGAREEVNIHETMCDPDGCRCEDGILLSALRHTLQIAAFILVITFLLNTLIFLIGEEALAGLILNRPVVGPILAALVGLIPNCAGSVLITELYLQGGMTAGAMLAGLLSASGVGLLVLYRTNRRRMRDNVVITALLVGFAVASGLLCDAMGVVF